jgi:hypothetical protein
VRTTHFIVCFPPCLSHSCPLAPSSFSSFVSFSSHFSPLCSAHSKDLLKKLSLEVSLLPKYPICAAAHTPHTRNCICTFTPQMVSLLGLPPAEPRQAITTHKHTSSSLHLLLPTAVRSLVYAAPLSTRLHFTQGRAMMLRFILEMCSQGRM